MALRRPAVVAIAVLLAIELLAMPWTAHAYDVASFLSHADRVFFAHVPPARLWAFGSVALAAVLLSQIAVLIDPRLWSAIPLRIALLKLPAWCADLATAAVVRACASHDGELWALRYLLDPMVIFVTVFHGQGDALPNAFAVGGIAAILTQRYELAAALLGLGAGTKFYPAAFVPLLAVAALRRGSARRAFGATAIFFAVATATLVPVLWGRAASITGAWSNNSFGPQGDRVATASLWTLLPHGTFVPQIEQAVAIAVPVALALAELRHVPGRIDIARAAMVAAMAIVLLNPGAHPPFYLWVAGPLVLYCAVAGDGLVSFGGVALSCLAILTQFCQEGSDEYFTLTFGPGQTVGWLHCLAPFELLQKLALVVAAMVVTAAYARPYLVRVSQAGRGASLAAAAVFAALFAAGAYADAARAASRHADRIAGFAEEERLVNTFAVPARVDVLSDGRCALTFDADDIVVYAGDPFAARFGSATLGYTLLAPAELTIRGIDVPAAALSARLENADVLTLAQRGVRLTRELDLSALLRPYRYVERIVERPCALVAGNPVLIYRFDFDAARAAAAATPLSQRWNVFRQTVQEPASRAKKSQSHV